MFFEFLKRWVENENRAKNVNEPQLYDRQENQEPFTLDCDETLLQPIRENLNTSEISWRSRDIDKF